MLINSNLLYPPDMAEESSQFMKNACMKDFLTKYMYIVSNTWTSGTNLHKLQRPISL